MPRKRVVLISKHVVVSFDGIDKDPFDKDAEKAVADQAEELVKAVSAAMRIPRERCTIEYDAELKSILFIYWFKKPKWAARCANRASAIRGATVTVLDDEPVELAG